MIDKFQFIRIGGFSKDEQESLINSIIRKQTVIFDLNVTIDNKTIDNIQVLTINKIKQSCK